VRTQEPVVPAYRLVECADADPWLEETRRTLPSDGRFAVVAVLPDAAELDLAPVRWGLWFSRMVGTCFHAARRAPVVFALTDRRTDGTWVDKAAIVAQARPHGHRLVLHRIALRRPPEIVDLKRPTYTHVLCYDGAPGVRTPDVFDGGQPLWRNGVGRITAREIAWWLAEQNIDGVLNPFCGHGTILAACGEAGLPSYGCDIDPARVEIARALVLPQLTDPRKDPST
jgi:hypothetical protein